MDPKLAILFLLISTVIGLSRLGEGHEGGMRYPSFKRRLRQFVPGRRKS
jgi:hypothetical protein